jgi:indole-3-glycerol phosphate synthase
LPHTNLYQHALMILDKIVAHKHTEVSSLPPVDRSVLRDLPACRGFRAALKRPPSDTIHVIAECKKGSPSKGVFVTDYDPVLVAYNYLLGGAHCCSVLTDEQFFYGHLDHLKRVHAAVALPTIRKDFIIDDRQIAEARLAGADAILLIVACLEDGQLRDLHGFAKDIGLDVLVEVHDATEAARALKIDADLIGVNNRNLHNFSVSLQNTYDLLPALIDGKRVVVSESGIHTREDCRALEAAGVDAVLVGEALMTAPDPAAALRKLRGKLLA